MYVCIDVYLNETPVLRSHPTGITIVGITNTSGIASNQLTTPFDLAVD